MTDTIAAISTALGVGAISIIRISGKESLNIVNKITKLKILEKAKTHTINYDYIMDQDNIIDEVLISVMLAPKTFTKEDTVEINCHGGIATTNKVLELLLTNGCRLAEPGEFTKRRFLNGGCDLIEAEGIMDLIKSKTDNARNLAFNQVNGNVSKLIKNLRQKILEILANIEVNIDYPEYEDIQEITTSIISEKIKIIEKEIKDILIKSENGQIIKDGINLALIGKPNVGKSSLLNCLLEKNKAIVTDIAGTTRDCVEGTIILDGIIINITDTAGIRQTNDIVESIGVNKSKEIIKSADLLLLLLNANEKLNEEDLNILKDIEKKNHLIVINKTDLENKIDLKDLNVDNIVYISALNNDGIEELKQKIKKIFHLEKIETEDLTYLANARALSLLRQSLKSIDDIKIGINNQMPIDMVGIDLKNIWNLLGNIIGEVYEEELLDQLFSQFCLGK